MGHGIASADLLAGPDASAKAAYNDDALAHQCRTAHTTQIYANTSRHPNKMPSRQLGASVCLSMDGGLHICTVWAPVVGAWLGRRALHDPGQAEPADALGVHYKRIVAVPTLAIQPACTQCPYSAK